MNTLTTEEKHSSDGVARKAPYFSPAANIFETTDGYMLEAEMPGVNKEGLEISVESNELTIIGRRTEAGISATPVYRESRDLNYKRVFDLDPSIDVAKISAKIDNGLLSLTLPKTESVKPRKIQVTD